MRNKGVTHALATTIAPVERVVLRSGVRRQPTPLNCQAGPAVTRGEVRPAGRDRRVQQLQETSNRVGFLLMS